ncbi:hypothetical protein V6N13_053456 [Hibiscus sabdariffa]|uniref:Uncharacterized protein n=1 Tax=Hibiscus sabdariffa TaxID=183260 RepID=A0ABR2T7I9_9ROSI
MYRKSYSAVEKAGTYVLMEKKSLCTAQGRHLRIISIVPEEDSLMRKKFGCSSTISKIFFAFQTERKMWITESPSTCLQEITLPTSQRLESLSSAGISVTTAASSSVKFRLSMAESKSESI